MHNILNLLALHHFEEVETEVMQTSARKSFYRQVFQGHTDLLEYCKILSVMSIFVLAACYH